MMYFKKYIFLFILFSLATTGYSQKNQKLKFSEGLAVQKVIFREKGAAYGFVNHKGKVVIPHIYDTVYADFQSGFAVVGKSSKAGLIDKKGKIVIAFDHKEIGEIGKFRIAVKNQEGLWGFYNHKGEKIISPMYQNYRFGSKGKIIVQKNGKWGIINEKGGIILDHHYKAIRHISEKNYQVWKVTQWNVKNVKNETVLSVAFDSLRYAGEKLYCFSMIGKKGLVDEKGKLVVGTEYEELYSFRYGLSKVKKDKYGIIRPSGSIVIPFEYDDIIIDSLYIRVKKVELEDGEYKTKWGLFDHKGNLLIKPKYTHMNSFSEGLIATRRADGTWGYISPSGATEIIFRYAEAEDFHHGLARVKVPYSLMKKDLYALIDKKGDYVITPANYDFYLMGLIQVDKYNKVTYIVSPDKYASYEKMNDYFVRVRQNNLYGMITVEGREIIPPVYDYVSEPSENGFIVVEKDRKTGVIDSKGNFTMKLTSRFEKVFCYHEGFSKMLMRGRYGFIDKHGDIWISAQYPDAGNMSDSMVNVSIRGKWAFVDRRENLKVQPYYEEVFPFKNGAAVVKENGKWNIVNKEGKELHINNLDKIEKTATGKYLLILADKVGMADINGRETLAIKYEEIKEIGNNMVMVKKNGLWGVLDYKENFIIPIEHDVIIYEPSNNTFITGVSGKQEQIHVK